MPEEHENDEEREWFESLEREFEEHGKKYILTILDDYDIDEIADILRSFDIPNKFEEYDDD